VLGPFDDVHDRADDDDDDGDEAEEDEDLAPARHQRAAERAVLLDVLGELEDSKEPQQAQQADVDQCVQPREEEGRPRRRDGDDVDDPEAARRVAQRPLHAHEAGDVLDREDDGEEPLEQLQRRSPARVQRLEAVDHDDGDAGEDQPDQDEVEGPPGAGVGLEDDPVERESPAARRPAEPLGDVVGGDAGRRRARVHGGRSCTRPAAPRAGAVAAQADSNLKTATLASRFGSVRTVLPAWMPNASRIVRPSLRARISKSA